MAEMRKEGWNRVALAALLGHFVLSIWFVERGRLNADEGWYLYAARMIALGQTPYLDFQFFQAPVYPRVMSGLIDPGPGSLLAGRWWSWLMLLLSTGVTALGARRVAGVSGAALALVCVGLHPLIVSTAVLAKPYALAMLLNAAGLFLLLGREGRSIRVVLGFALLALAVGTRISLLAFLLPLIFAQRGRQLACAAVGSGVGLALIFPSIQGVAWGVLWEQWVGFHLSDGGTWSARLAWCFHVLMVWCALGSGLMRGSPPIPGLRTACVLGVLVHLAPEALHVEHIVVLAPPLALLVAARWGAVLMGLKPIALGVLIWMFGVGASIRFVHLDDAHSTVQQTMELGEWLQSHVPEGQKVLTRQVALAVEADRDVVPGCEMGRFGDMDRARVMKALRDGVGGVAIAEGDFDQVVRAEIARLSEAQFPHRRAEEPYGQFDERIWMWAGSAIWMR